MKKNLPGDPKADILIVDDTPDNLRLLNQILSKTYKVRLAPSGSIGLTAARSATPDLILLDVMMPEINGYEVAAQLKAEPQTAEVPIIFISALDDVDSKIRGFTAGGVDYITKPFQEAEVLARVRTHLELHILYKQAQEEIAERKRVEEDERKRAEAALYRSKQQLEATLNALPDLLFELDQNRRFIDYRAPNPSMLFAPPDQFLGKTIYEVLPEEVTSIIDGTLEKALQVGVHFGAVYSLSVMNKVSWYELSVSVKKETDEQEPHFIVLAHNITERKLAQEQLQQSQASLEMAQSIARLGSWEFDLTTGADFWAKEMFYLINRDPSQGIPTQAEFMELVHPEDRQTLQDARQRALETGAPATLEYRICLDGETSSLNTTGERFFQATLHPSKDEHGRVVRLSGTMFDITELKKAQLELEALNRELERRVEERTAEVRQSEATYRALFENSNDGIFLLTPQGEELAANPQALAMIGYTIEEYKSLPEKGRNSLVPLDQKGDAEERLQSVLNGEPSSLYERTLIAKDGRRVEVEINLSGVRDPQGNVVMVQSVVRDITERKKAEAVLRESRDKLSAANAALKNASRMKDEFLASMSHELRTPLTGILGLSEILQLQTYGPLGDKQLKALKNIESSGRHLLDLINDILDLSKIEAGKLDMQIAPCSVGNVCQASLQLIKGMAHQKQQTVHFTMHPGSIIVNADERRLKQMLVNLLSNAVKFTPKGGDVGLEVGIREADQVVLFEIWDKGIGIAPENLGKLFKPFIQLDSSLARQYSGTGLGLSLVQRMAELHGGSVKVKSVVGEGSRFTISLPWSADLSQAVLGLPKQDPGSLKNALVIEDNILDAENITRYFKELSIASVVQPTIDGAMEKAISLHPDAIILDIHLPDGSGLDLLARLKANEHTLNIPVIITSVDERRSEAMNLGALGYLVKPFTQQELHAEMARAASQVHPTASVMVIGERASAGRVLIADDNELILETITAFLEARGYQAVATRSGFELLERAPEFCPNIILVDIQMPGIDGIETIRRLRANTDPAIASVPIIAVTALAMAGDREKCLQAGANDYMSKPIALTLLAERIGQLLKLKG